MFAGSYSTKPTLELWGRTLRWLERLRSVAARPLYDEHVEPVAAFDVSDHSLVVLGCCDAMRDWLRKPDDADESEAAREKRRTLVSAVDELFDSPNLRACRDVVNTFKHLHLRLDRRYHAAEPSNQVVRLIGEERDRQGKTEMWPEEFRTTTEPFFAAMGRPARWRVLFPGKDEPSLDLLELVEACVAELDAFVQAHGLGPRHEGERVSYGYPPRAPKTEESPST